MGLRWDDEQKAFEPMPVWIVVLISVAVGIAIGYLLFAA